MFMEHVKEKWQRHRETHGEVSQGLWNVSLYWDLGWGSFQQWGKQKVHIHASPVLLSLYPFQTEESLPFSRSHSPCLFPPGPSPGWPWESVSVGDMITTHSAVAVVHWYHLCSFGLYFVSFRFLVLYHNYLREGQCKVDWASVCLCFELEAVFGFLSVAWKGVGGTFAVLFSFHPVVLCFCFLKTITSFWLGVVCVVQGQN